MLSSRKLWAGLRNAPGNICFLNSVLQSLSSVRSLATYVNSVSATPSSLPGQLASTLRDLTLTRSDHLALDASGLLFTPGMPRLFQSREQQDAQELYTALLDVLDEQLAARVRPALVAVSPSPQRLLRVDRGRGSPSRTTYRMPGRPKNPFVGMLASAIKCGGCNSVCSVSYSEFSSLSLFIPPSERVTLADCLEHYTSTERVRDFECEKCRKTGAVSKRVLLGRLPESLCLHLQRSVGGDDFGGESSKISSHVRFPERLDLSQYAPNANPDFFSRPNESIETLVPASPSPGHIRGGSEADAVRRSPLTSMHVSPGPVEASADYHLRAVVVHLGKGAQQGHFTAYRKAPTRCASDIDYEAYIASGAPEKWVFFNDEKCIPASEKQVFSAKAYMLFYERLSCT